MKVINLLIGKLLYLVLIVGVEIITCLLLYRLVIGGFFGFVALVILKLIAFLYSVRILNLDKVNEYKLSFLILISLFTSAGILSYHLFGGRRSSKKQKESYNKHLKIALEHLASKERTCLISSQSNDVVPHSVSSLSEKANRIACDEVSNKIATLINVSNGFPVVSATRCCYFNSGKDFFDIVCEKIASAKHFVFLEFFILSGGVLFERIFGLLEKKAREGVEIRLIYDDLGSIMKPPKGLKRRCKDFGIKLYCFNRLLPFLDSGQGARTHRKIVVVDGEYAFTGGVNIADEYVGIIGKFGYWKDSGIMVKGGAVDYFTSMFLASWCSHFGEEDIKKFFTQPLEQNYCTHSLDMSINHTELSDVSINHSNIPSVSSNHKELMNMSSNHTPLDDLSNNLTNTKDESSNHTNILDMSSNHTNLYEPSSNHTFSYDVSNNYTTLNDMSNISNQAYLSMNDKRVTSNHIKSHDSRFKEVQGFLSNHTNACDMSSNHTNACDMSSNHTNACDMSSNHTNACDMSCKFASEDKTSINFKPNCGEFVCIPFYDYPENDSTLSYDIFLSLIYSAKKSVYIHTPYLVIDQKMICALSIAASRGVDVRIVTPSIPDKKLVFALTRSNYNPLINSGVKIYEYQLGFMHSKLLLVDKKYCSIGTTNMDYRSFFLHHECNVYFEGGCSEQIAKDFENDCEVSKLVPIENSPIKRAFRAFLRIIAPLC